MTKQTILDILCITLLSIGTCAVCACEKGIGEEETPIFLKECGPTTSLVSRVIDGDTIELTSGEKVRYLLVNTPEKGECHYQNAFNFNTEYVLGKTVNLGYDVQCTDKYGRLLAYVESEDGIINELLLVRGHARLLHIPPNGDEYIDYYRDLEWSAKESNLGLWRYCE